MIKSHHDSIRQPETLKQSNSMEKTRIAVKSNGNVVGIKKNDATNFRSYGSQPSKTTGLSTNAGGF
jgi:hypothetical protein